MNDSSTFPTEAVISTTVTELSRELRMQFSGLDIDAFVDCLHDGALHSICRSVPERYGKSGLRGFMYRTVRNRILNYIEHLKTRKAKLFVTMSRLCVERGDSCVGDTEESVYSMSDDLKNLACEVWSALDGLDDDEMRVLILKHADEVSDEEIVKELRLRGVEDVDAICSSGEEKFRTAYLTRTCVL
jgi:DNA-directed RNA polymerase specialized sigma24 family protein